MAKKLHLYNKIMFSSHLIQFIIKGKIFFNLGAIFQWKYSRVLNKKTI